jgi:DNA-binding transcriptional LysR family regulator
VGQPEQQADGGLRAKIGFQIASGDEALLTEIRTFIAVCRLGTFAAAGHHIGLTQSAVSSQIKRLEQYLGFELFERTGRSATLNAAGQATLERARELDALVNRLREPFAQASSLTPLRVGAIASMQPTLIAQALRQFRKAFPTLCVQVAPGVSMRLMDDVDAGKTDLAVMVRPPFGMPSDMEWQSLTREPFVLLVPASTPVGRRDHWRTLLQGLPFLRYDRTSFGGRAVDAFLRREGLTVEDAVEIDDIPGLIQLVAQGVGAALVPMTVAHLPLPEGIRMLRLGPSTFFREIGTLRRKRTQAPSALSKLTELLQEAAAAQAAQLRVEFKRPSPHRSKQA